MQTSTGNKSSGLFVNLALVMVLLTVGLIVFGAVVRVTDSGLGCGNDWPLCDGRVIPPLDNVTAWIEWSHRLIAALIGVLGLAMLWVAVRAYRTRNPIVLGSTVIAALLFVLQSALGAFVVIFDLPPTMVTLHLGTAMLLLAALLVAGIGAWHRPARDLVQTTDHVTALAYITAALSLVIILSGALVRGSGATLACTTWPLCNGEIIPSGDSLRMVHMMHRLAVAGLGVTLVMLVWYIYRERRSGLLRGLSVAALVTYGAQALVGAFYVWSSAGAVWGAAHVGLASLTWALLVGVCSIDTLNSRTVSEKQILWQQQSETATG